MDDVLTDNRKQNSIAALNGTGVKHKHGISIDFLYGNHKILFSANNNDASFTMNQNEISRFYVQ